MKRALIPIFIPHLGCPNACVFCNQRAIAGQQVPSGAQVRQQIEAALQYTLQPQIAFYGGSFTAIDKALQREYLSAAYPFVQSGQADSIRLSTRPDCIDSQGLSLLASYGVRTVELGAQSMHDAVLQASGRGHTAAHTVDAVKLLRQRGFEVILQLMVGLPGADQACEVASARAMAALRPDAVRIYPVCVLPHTQLAERYRTGAYMPLTVEDATELCADVLEVFDDAGIPAVRIGLNPTEELGSSVLAGAYHPAMGELVRSRLLRRKVCAMLDAVAPPAVVTLRVPRGRGPLLRGQKNCNMQFFKDRYPRLAITIAEDLPPEEKIVVAIG